MSDQMYFISALQLFFMLHFYWSSVCL